jgi:hypothetical protein
MTTIVQTLFLLAVLAIFATTYSFRMHTRLTMSSTNNQEKKEIVRGKIWPGNRPPVPNLQLLEQRMDSTWGRGKYRAEIWDGNDNPLTNWWESYTPSEETMEAIALGFDFTNPKEWLEV